MNVLSRPSAYRYRAFVSRNRPKWARLEELLRRVERNEGSRDTLDELGRAYRRTATHLAYAQTFFPEHEVTRELNRLVVRAHNVLYGSRGKSEFRKVLWFFGRDFPALFHERASWILWAGLIFFIGAVFAFVSTLMNPVSASAFLPPEYAAGVDPHGVDQPVPWDHAVISSTIMVNNIQVAFFCFAWGALLGVGTLWVLFSNGLLLGSLAALFYRAGESYVFWAYIWPHGVIELTAIFIAGGAGLSLARSFLVPGDLPRLEAFKREGKVTVQLVAGVVPLFILAALIEGFVTPAPWPHWTKYGIALLTLAGLVGYFGRGPFQPTERRKEHPAHPHGSEN